MSEYLNLTAGGVDFLSLPAGKITRYPLEARDYRPFAQVQLALSPDALHVRLLAFEAEPPAGSMLLLALEGGIVLPFSADENGPVPAGQVRVERLRGEDLQGIYWGVHAMLPRAVLEERVGRVIRPGGVLRGNVLKICPSGERRHFGCLFESPPVWSAEEAGNARFGEWEAVDY